MAPQVFLKRENTFDIALVQRQITAYLLYRFYGLDGTGLLSHNKITLDTIQVLSFNP